MGVMALPDDGDGCLHTAHAHADAHDGVPVLIPLLAHALALANEHAHQRTTPEDSVQRPTA